MRQDKMTIPATKRRLPFVLLPLTLGSSAILRFAQRSRGSGKRTQTRVIDRMNTEQLANQLGLTVLVGHPDQKALHPNLQDSVKNWRDHDWRSLGQRLDRFDKIRARLPSGERIAPALGRALFRYLAGPANCAVIDRGQSVPPEDLPENLFEPLMRVLTQPQINPSLHFLAAQFHLELGWARYGDDYAEYALDGSISSAEARFRTASNLLDRISPHAPHSSYFCEIDYRTRAANGTTEDDLTRAAIRWSRTDPKSLIPYTTHGLHLLQRFYGGERSLPNYADRSWSLTHESLGAAAYAAIYLSAIEGDLEAAPLLNKDVFREGLIDMMQESEDPDLACNAILRTLWDVSSDAYTDTARESKTLREARRHLRALFCDLARNTLGPVMPDVWGGRWTEAKILHALAEAFETEIAEGKAVAIGLEGAVILD